MPTSMGSGANVNVFVDTSAFLPIKNRRDALHKEALALKQRVLDIWSLFKRFADKEFSFTDCTSFVLMRRLGLHEALAFDGHFTQAGFAELRR